MCMSRQGAYLVNTARGAICNTEDVAAALKSGQLNGYAGDVWNVQPAPKDHPWRYMKNALGGGNGMTPHYSGTTLDAQARYAAGTKQILENYFQGKPQEPANIIVGVGKYESKSCEYAGFHRCQGLLTLYRQTVNGEIPALTGIRIHRS